MTKGVLAPVLVDEPIVDFDVVVTTSVLIPPPIISVTSVVPSLIPQGSTIGQGSTAIATPGSPGPTVTITYSGAWPQENFPNYLYKYVILPNTVNIMTVNNIDDVPIDATIIGYVPDLTPFLINTWTITVSDGTVLADTQIVNNNWTRQQLKLKARVGA